MQIPPQCAYAPGPPMAVRHGPVAMNRDGANPRGKRIYGAWAGGSSKDLYVVRILVIWANSHPTPEPMQETLLLSTSDTYRIEPEQVPTILSIDGHLVTGLKAFAFSPLRQEALSPMGTPFGGCR